MGIPIFIFFMWLTFFTTFKVGGYPKHWMELGIGKLSELISYILPSGIVKDFFVEGIIGRSIEPVMKPLGFDWRLSVSILSGLAAKEVVVSTLGVIYQADYKSDKASLVEKIQSQQNSYGTKAFTPLIAFSFMLFILTYFPCIGVVAVIKRESGSWKWATFTVFYTTVIAWLLSFSFYQIGSLFL